MTKFDPFKNLKLDKYEQELEDSFDEWVSVGNMKENRKIASIIAKNTLKDLEKKEAKKKITTTVKDLQDFIYKKTRKKISYDKIVELGEKTRVLSEKKRKYKSNK